MHPIPIAIHTVELMNFIRPAPATIRPTALRIYASNVRQLAILVRSIERSD